MRELVEKRLLEILDPAGTDSPAMLAQVERMTDVELLDALLDEVRGLVMEGFSEWGNDGR